MSSNANLGNTPVNQGYVQLIHTGETGGITTALQSLYDGDGTASDLQIASNKVKVSTELFIGSKTLSLFIQDTVGAMFSGNTETNISVTYQTSDNTIDLVATGAITGLTGGTGIDISGSGNLTVAIDSTVATQSYVNTQVANIVDSAPSTLDTLNELAAALGDDPNFATTTATNIGTKLAKASNLSDLANVATARTNLGLGTGAVLDTAGVSNGATTLATGNAIYDHVTTRISGKVDTSGSPVAQEYARFTDSNTIEGRSYSAVRTDLGLVIGTNVQAQNDLLQNVADFPTSTPGNDGKVVTYQDSNGTLVLSNKLSPNGSTANGLLTYNTATLADVESTLTYNSLTLTNVGSTAKIVNNLYQAYGPTTNVLDLDDDQSGNTSNQVSLKSINHINMMIDGSDNNTGDFRIYTGGYDQTGTLAFKVAGANSNVTIGNKLYIPEYIEHNGDSDTFIRFTADRVRIDAGGSTKFDSDNTYVETSRSITPVSLRGISGGGDLSANRTLELSASQLGSATLNTTDKLILFDSNDVPKKFTAQDIFDTISGAVTIYSNTGDNRVLTSGGGTTINGESNLTFDGSTGLLLLNQDSNAEAFRVTGGGGGNKIASFIRDVGVASPYAETYIHAGSADPQITFRSSANQYFSMGIDLSASSFKISENTGVGTNDRLTIDTSGNVGIGVASPNHLLEIESQTNDVEVVQISNDAGGSGSVTGITHLGISHFPENTYSSTRITAIENGTASYTGHLAFSTRSTNSDSAPAERMRITSAGNVGIGITNPASLLTVNGTARFNTATGSDPFWITRQGNTNESLRIYVDDSSAVFQTFQDETSGDRGNFIFVMDSDSTAYTDFRHGSATKMRIKSNGNVGIGELSPDRKLHITGSENELMCLESTDTNTDLIFADTGGSVRVRGASGNFDVYTGGTASSTSASGSTYAFRIESDGDFRLRTPDDKRVYFGVNNSASFRTSSAGYNLFDSSEGAFYIRNTISNQNIYFGINDGGTTVYPMTVHGSSSNVGIGTTSPGNKLEVRGDIAVAISDTQDIIKLSDAGNDGSIEIYTGEATPTLRTKIVSYGDTYFNAASTGRVGIGTASPAYKLDVNGTARFQGSVRFPDSIGATFGDSGDLQIFHNGSYGNITNGTGNLYIDNTTDNADMYFRVDDAGTLFTAMRIDGSEIGNVHLPNDGQNLYIGQNNDIRLVHLSGTNYMYTYNGPFYLGAVSTDQDVFIRGNDGGASINAVQFDMSDAGTAIFNHDIWLKDDLSAIRFGAGKDGSIYSYQDDLWIANQTAGQDTIFRNLNSAGTTYVDNLFIDGSAERVGIGTTSPSSKLHVKDATDISMDASANGQVRVEGNGYALGIALNGSGAFIYQNSSLRFMAFGNNETEQVRLTTGGALHVVNDVVAYSSTPSDKKLKTNIKDIDYGLDTILKLKPKQYDWKKDNRHDIGFIAQEVEEVIPEIIKDNEWFDDKIKTMDYEKLTAVLIKAVQEQQQQINELKEKLNG